MNLKSRKIEILLLLSFLITSCGVLNPIVFYPTEITAHPSTTKNGKIVYIGSDQNIYIYDVETKGSLNITQNNGEQKQYRAPSWSRDSTKLVFSESTPNSEKLFSYDLATETWVELYSHNTSGVIYPYWAPDNLHVSVLTNTNTPELALYWANAESGKRALLDLGQPFYWAISPDSSQILYHQNASLNDGGLIGLLEPSQNSQPLPLEFESGKYLAPQWTANGQIYLIATSDSSFRDQLIAINSDGEVQDTIAEGVGRFAFALSPDENYLAVIKNDILNEQFFQGKVTFFNLKTGEEVFATADQNIVAFFWAPDGSKLVYFTFNLINDDLETGHAGKNAAPVISLQNQEIILSAKTLDLATFEIQSLENQFIPSREFLQLLGFFDQYHRSDTLWSPDSTQLVLSGQPMFGEMGIWIYNPTTLEKVFIAEGELAFWSWE